MADLNTIYEGVNDVQDADIVLAKVCKGVSLPFGGCIGPLEDLHLPDEVRDEIRANNARALETIANVKVEYVPGTDRKAFLKARIDAIAARGEFIRERVSSVLDYLKATSTDAFNAVASGVASALSLLPGIGPIIASANAGSKAAQQLELYKAQSLITRYTDDLKQLAAIRTQLAADYAAIDKTTDAVTVVPGNSAPNPNANYYYIAGGILLLVFIVWLNRKRKK